MWSQDSAGGADPSKLSVSSTKLSCDQSIILFWSVLTSAGKKMLIQRVFPLPESIERLYF